MFDIQTVVVVAQTITLVFGGLITFFALRAYRRTGSGALRSLALGLGLVTAGTLVGGAIHQLAEGTLVLGVAVQSCFTAVGFLVLAYSLYATGQPGTDALRSGVA